MGKLKFRDYFRVHIDIPTIVIILLVILILFRQLTTYIFQSVKFISGVINTPPWVRDMGINIVSELIGAGIIILIGYLYFKIKRKPFFAGNFKTFEITKELGKDDVVVEWGTLKLTYNIFSKRVKGKMINCDKSECIEIEGEFNKDRYLMGTYCEYSKPSRLRLGAFIMILDGQGDNYEGPFLHLSPYTNINDPLTGYAKWVKIK